MKHVKLFSKNADNQLYLVMDPFNFTYNPAKAIKFNSNMYPTVFLNQFKRLQEGEMDLESLF